MVVFCWIRTNGVDAAGLKTKTGGGVTHGREKTRRTVCAIHFSIKYRTQASAAGSRPPFFPFFRTPTSSTRTGRRLLLLSCPPWDYPPA